MIARRETAVAAFVALCVTVQGCGGGGGEDARPSSVDHGTDELASSAEDPSETALPPPAAPQVPVDDAPDTAALPARVGDTNVPERFLGTWQTDCRREVGTFARSLAYIEADRVESGTMTFLDALCTVPLQASRFASDTTFGTAVTLADGSEAVEADIRLIEPVTLAALDESVAAGFSRRRLCDIRDWVTGVAYDVSDCDAVTARFGPAFRTITRQIYSLQGEELFVGRHVPTAFEPFPVTRPTELDYTFPFRRVAP